MLRDCNGERTIMTVGPGRSRDLLSRLVGASPEARGSAADGVTDWLRSFDSQEAAIIAGVLLWLASVETDDSAREAQPHALAELAGWDLVPKDVLTELGLLSPGELRGSSKEVLLLPAVSQRLTVAREEAGGPAFGGSKSTVGFTAVNGLVLPVELVRALFDGRWIKLGSSSPLAGVFGSEPVKPRFHSLKDMVAINGY
jgi:hypothetical protein